MILLSRCIGIFSKVTFYIKIYSCIDISCDTGLEGRLAMRPTRTLLQAKLSDLSVEDLTENTLHPKILTIEDDNVFDFKV